MMYEVLLIKRPLTSKSGGRGCIHVMWPINLSIVKHLCCIVGVCCTCVASWVSVCAADAFVPFPPYPSAVLQGRTPARADRKQPERGIRTDALQRR